jgi:hypothetical protein
MIDLNAWHHAIHPVTGDTALLFNRATAADLGAGLGSCQRWRTPARQLRTAINSAKAEKFFWWRNGYGHDFCNLVTHRLLRAYPRALKSSDANCAEKSVLPTVTHDR